MNQGTPPVGAAQATAEWQPERRTPRDLPALRAQAGSVDVSTDGAPAGAGRVLNIGLDAGIAVDLRPVTQSPAGAAILAARPELALAAAEPLVAEPAAELGSTARLISRLLAGTQTSQPITSTAPLATTPRDVAGVAAGLKEAIRSSGLFYESHLADWVAGQGDKTALMREPQAALQMSPPQSGDPTFGMARLAPQAEALVQRQLDTLERNEATWQGSVWPGQEAEVRVCADARQQRESGDRSWQATVRLSFPGLGDVDARLELHGKRTRVSLRTAEPHAAVQMQAARQDFARALREQGLMLAEAKVDHAGAA